ncbi:MAG: ClpXP protease specificity-enhancing factor [Pseudomonadota bacterium]
MTQSTKPYLMRAIYEWCMDQGFTPYIAVVVDERTVVPRQYVRDGQIVLNIGPDATHQLVMGNELVTFNARFGGVAHSLSIPVDNVAAIYARENGQGMAFEIPPSVPAETPADEPQGENLQPSGDGSPDEPTPPGRPHLKRIK